MELKKSPVVFNEEDHRYQLGDKRLLGITGLIHSILGLGVYPDADPYTKDFVIPKAGSRGTAIHHAIQTYDEIGIRQAIQTVHTKYGCKERDNVQYKDEVWDVALELDNYVRHLEGFEPIANEYTVSDHVKWASQIDNVWRRKETQGLWLVDTKSNNITLYPTCGYFIPNMFATGEEALREYLSWQLSVYAVLFERQNPGLKVEGLACNWLRKEDAAFWIIERKPDDLVLELLSSDYLLSDNGPIYFHRDVSVFGIGKRVPHKAEPQVPILPEDVISYVGALARNCQELSNKLDEAKTAMRKAMEEHGIKKFDNPVFVATIAKDSMTESFDAKRFKAEHPELFKQYVTVKPKKGSFTLKLKSDD